MLSDAEILNIVLAEKAEAVGYSDELGENRETLLDYYNMQPFGDERDGYSKYVSSDVSDVVEGMMPSLLRIFTAGGKAFHFTPNTPEQEEECNQKTELVNHVFFAQNQGVLVLANKIKDALLQYSGVVKVCWDEELEVEETEYEGLSDIELRALELNKDVKLKDVEGYVDEMGATVYNATAKMTKSSGRVSYENIPPEEFLISRNARDFVDPVMIGHRTPKTRSDLIEMGFDKDIVNSLPAYSRDGQGDRQKSSRYWDFNNSQHSNPSQHSPNDIIELTEMYIKMDVDEDGISELWQIFEAGNKVLEKKIWDEHPFACSTPIPLPHRAIGTCPAAQVADIQLTKSVLVRHALDNIYTSNYQRVAANQRVDMDDLLTPRPGGVVRIDGDGPISDSLFPIPTIPQVDQVLKQIEYIDTSSERRTGFTRFSQGLDADALNHTATGFRGINQNGRERVEVIARVLAETGVKELGRKTASLLTKFQDTAMQIMVSGQPLEINPGAWRHSLDCVVSTGLGTGDRGEKIANLNVLLERQIQAKETGTMLTDEGKIFNTLSRMVQEIGLEDPEMYWNDPTKPDELLQIENEAQRQYIQQLEAQIQQNPLAEAEMVKAQARLAEVNQKESLKAQELQAKTQLELMKMAQEDEHFRQEMIRDLTKLELDSGENVPGAAV